MSKHVRAGLAGVCFGLLFMGFGLIWVADLFGVGSEHARQVRENRINRRFLWPDEAPPISRVMRWGRLTGAAFMLAGAAMVAAGVISLAVGSD